jgi:hypothetical protein
MIKLRDHYFIAWLNVVKDIHYSINNNNNGVLVDMSRDEYTKYLEEYKSSIQPVLKKIRVVVKELSLAHGEVGTTTEKNKF